MRAIIYHYVRPADPRLPGLVHLNVEDFRRQVAWFARVGGLATRDDLDLMLSTGTRPRGKFLLTFDDGLRDHYEHVTPSIEAAGAGGVSRARRHHAL